MNWIIAQIVTISIILLAWIIIRNIYINPILKAWRTQCDRYALFELRDRIIMLVGDRKLPADDAFFQLFYPAINESIEADKDVTSRQYRKQIKGMWNDEFRQDRLEKVGEIIKNSPSEAQTLACDYFRVMAMLYAKNSSFVRFILVVVTPILARHLINRILGKFRDQIKKWLYNNNDDYRIHQNFKHLANC